MKLFGSGGNNKTGGKKPPSENTSRERVDTKNYVNYDRNEYDAADEAIREYSKKKRHRRIITVAVILAILAGAAIAFPFLIHPPETNEDGITNPDPDASPPMSTDGAPKVSQEPVITDDPNSLRKPGTYTFLCVGSDDGNGNTDTILAGLFDTVNKKLNIVSIPRDTLVNVRWAAKKLNTILSSSTSPDASEEERISSFLAGFRDILGYTVDFYVHIDIQGFEKVVDAIGGVWFDVPFDMQYFDPDQDFWVDIKAGSQLLNGIDSMKVVRYREGLNAYPDGDLGRINTQHEFLKAAAAQLLQIGNVTKVNEFARIFSEHVETSLSLNEIAWLGIEFLKLDSKDISFFKMPGDEGPWIYDGYIPEGTFIAYASYVSADIDAWLDMLNEYLNPWKQEIKEGNLNMITYDKTDGSFYSTSGKFAQ